MLWCGTVQIERDGLDGFRQLATQIGCRVLRFQTPTSDVVDVLHLLLFVAILHGRFREVAYAPVFLTTTHGLVGQQENVGFNHHRDVDLVSTFLYDGGQLRQSYHATLKGLDTDDARQFTTGIRTNVQLVEYIIQDILPAIEQVTDIEDDRR